jgi:uncharacterized OB-fold protein
MANEFGTLTKGVFPSILKNTYADDTTQPFWDAAKLDRLVAPKCTSCGTFRLPPAPCCWVCQHRDVEWVELPGTGTIYTFIVVRHPLHPDMAECCPYVSGAVDLDGTQGEGARLLVNIIDCDPETVRIGDRVEIVFEHVNEEMHTPRFRPIMT